MKAKRFSIQTYVLATALTAVATGSRSHAQTCAMPSAGPDVIVGRLNSVVSWGSVGDIAAFSVGTTSCNLGDTVLLWKATLTTHPVIGQNMYRLKDNRFEQIGMSWLKHGFLALAQNECCTCQNPNDGSVLGLGCSDPYSANLNGRQGSFGTGGLGPRFEVNANTGAFEFPYAFQGDKGDAIFKRLQVHHADLDPASNVGALYFVDGHYVTPDDAAAGNQDNNSSYQQITVGGTAPNFFITLTGSTQREQPPIQAWADLNPIVTLEPIDDPDGGRFILAYDVTDNGDGTWHYEYALYNMNSDLSAGSFSIPVPSGVTVTNVGFHDVDYHSGEPWDGTDWSDSEGGGALTWATAETFDENEFANALRWGTTYNFRFDADAAPTLATATIGLFKPTDDPDLPVDTLVPGDPPGTPLPPGVPVVIVPGGAPCDPAVDCTPLADELLIVTNTCAEAGRITVELFDQDLHPGALRYRSAGRTLVIETNLDDGCFNLTIVMPFSAAELANDDLETVALTWFDDRSWKPAVCGNTTPAPLCPFPNTTFVLEVNPTPEPTVAVLHARDLGAHGVYWSGTSGFAWANVDHPSDFAAAISLGPIPTVSHWGALALALSVLTAATLLIRRRQAEFVP